MDYEDYFGVVFEKKELVEGVNIYFPEYIADGYLLKDEEDNNLLFEDKYGNEFMLLNDSASFFYENKVVGYVIKEKDLLETEEGLSLSEAKSYYYSEILDTTCIGYYIYKDDKVVFLDFNFSNVLEAFNELGVDENGRVRISADDLIKLLLDYPGDENLIQYGNKETNENGISSSTPTIYMSIDSLKNIINQSPDDVKETLCDIYNQYANDLDNENVKESKLNNKELEKLNDVYDYILKIDDINKMKKMISKLIDMYTELLVSLDDIKNETVKEYALNFICSTVDIYDALLMSNDLKFIKKTIQEVIKKQENHIKLIMNNYEPEKIYSNEADESHKQKEEELNEAFNNNDSDIPFDVAKMKEFFDKKIIGQEQAKKDVISALFMNGLMDDPNSKNTCLLIGPTGSGKTLIAEAASEFLDLPYVVIDTTQLTMPGYVGANIEDFLSRLIASANGDVEKAQKGVVVLDEIDKKGSEDHGDVAGRGVLNTLLPFIQGTTYNMSYNGRKIQFDTSRLTIFATGAFTDVAKEKNNSCYGNGSIGFAKKVDKVQEEDIKYEKIERDDLVKYGKMPIELLGRISTITQLSGHTKESLKQILTDSNTSVLKKEQEKLKKINVNLKWNDKYLDATASKALELKTGARSLKSIVEKSIEEARWNAINNIGEFSDIILNEKSVTDPKQAVLVYKDGCDTTVEALENPKENGKVLEKINDKKNV